MRLKMKPFVYAGLVGMALFGACAQAHASDALPVCNDGQGREPCRMDLRNGNFEGTTFVGDPYGWNLLVGKFGAAPYIGNTPDSHVLALPGEGAQAYVALPLPPGSSIAKPGHVYTVKLRARGSGPMPATLAAALAVAPKDDTSATRELVEHRRTVGWDWEDIEFKVDGNGVVATDEPGLLIVGLQRVDGHSATLLQVDDVRIERESR
jgi:hypothetical protein